MLAILNSLNAHYLPIFQQILMILVSKFMIHRVPSDKTYLSLGLPSPLKKGCQDPNPSYEIVWICPCNEFGLINVQAVKIV